MSNLIQLKQIEGLSGGLLTPATHRPLDQLVHEIAETSFVEYVYSANKVTDIITWTDSGKTIKIREESFVFTAGKIDTITMKQYDGLGVLVETLVSTFNFTGNQLTSEDVVLS